MNDTRELLLATVNEIFEDRCTAETIEAAKADGWSAELWRTILVGPSTGETTLPSSYFAGSKNARVRVRHEPRRFRLVFNHKPRDALGTLDTGAHQPF